MDRQQRRLLRQLRPRRQCQRFQQGGRPAMTVIDLSGHLNDIRRRYPEYWDSGEAVRELQALWGGADCNDCGVFERDETIRIQLDGQKSWYGEVHIANAPNGWHAISTSYWYGQGGGGSSPSVWNRTAYTTRDEAVAAGINKLIAAFEGIRDCKGYAPQNQSALAQRMIETLKAYLAHSRQLSLF